MRTLCLHRLVALRGKYQFVVAAVHHNKAALSLATICQAMLRSLITRQHRISIVNVILNNLCGPCFLELWYQNQQQCVLCFSVCVDVYVLIEWEGSFVWRRLGEVVPLGVRNSSQGPCGSHSS